MKAVRVLRSMAVVALKELLGALARPKTVVILVFVGLAIMLSAWVLAHAALGAMDPETPPDPILLWHKGADGALVSLAFGVVPLVLPLIPIIMVNDNLQRDRTTGFLEASITGPTPRWTLALAKHVGTLLAVAIPVIILGFGSSMLIQNIVSSPVDFGLVLAFVGSALLLATLYLALAMSLTTILPPGAVLGICVLAWIAFNVITPSAFLHAGQFFLVVQVTGPQTFQATWIDLGTFTGVYQALMALFVPSGLEFVVWPGVTDLSGFMGALISAAGVVPWLLFLLLLQITLFTKIEV